MNSFSVLFKQECKEYFPFFRKNEKKDIVGNGLSFAIILILAVGIIFLFLSVVSTYITVELNRVEAPYERASELLNAMYVIISILLVVFGLEKIRKVVNDQKDKAILLRLPIKSSTIFLVKFIISYLLLLVMGIILILPTNIIFYVVLKPSWTFFLGTLITILFLPSISFFIAILLVVPYTLVLNFFNDKKILTLISYVLLIGIGFYAYSLLLNVFRTLLETGSIKYLFNESFVVTLQNILKYTYPVNIFTSITMGNNLLTSWLIFLALIIVVLVSSFFLSRVMFYHTLYRNELTKEKIKKTNINPKKPFVAILKKEFILTWRNNAYLFSYFAIAIAMPLIIYCCFTLFKQLLYNSLGLTLDFELALFLTLIFVVLTNTYCATNITRDGIAFLKTKTFPYSVKKILLSKVVFCFIVSSISILASTIMLGIIGDIGILNLFVILILAIFFSTSQILLGTRFDLNNAKLILSQYEIDRESSKTIAKLVFIGLVMSLFIGIGLIGGKLLLSVVLSEIVTNVIVYMYIFILTLGFFIVSYIYYIHNVEEQYLNLVC